jgi:hypothetical protein
LDSWPDVSKEVVCEKLSEIGLVADLPNFIELYQRKHLVEALLRSLVKTLNFSQEAKPSGLELHLHWEKLLQGLKTLGRPKFDNQSDLVFNRHFEMI